MAEEIKKGAKYDATNITVLEGIEAVRMRPAMYIGDTGVRGLHHCVYEAVDNSIDEALAGYCDRVQVALNADGSVSVADNGRGIPVDIHATEKKPAVEVVLTTLHAGGKFDNESYKVSGGLHGVGISCVNALSEWFEVEVRRDGQVYHQRYERGHTVSPLTVIGKTKTTGTKVTFFPDATIFSTTKFEWDILANRLRELAFLNRGVEIRLSQEEPAREEIFKYKGGIVEFVEHLNRSKVALHPKVIYFEKEKDGIQVEIALQYTEAYNESVFCYANNINTIEGGTHLSGFRSALTRTINAYGKANKVFKSDDEALSGDDVREGLTAIVSVRLPRPQFEGQTKTKLGNGEVEGIVRGAVADDLRVDVGATGARPFEVFEHEHRGALSHHEPVVLGVEGSGGLLRLVVVGGKDAHLDEAGENDREQAGVGAADEGGVDVSAADHLHRLADGVATAGAGGDDSVVGTADAGADGDLAGGAVRHQVLDEVG